MLKIRDLEVNQTVTIPCVVKSATARETKAKKPYLSLEFYDGVDTIMGNYWDWTSGNIPAVNTILDVTAQVTEWQGTKQLNVKKLVVNLEKHISEFAPESGYNIAEVFKQAYECTLNVRDDALRNLTLSILDTLQERWLSVPGAVGVHHAYVGGTLVHSLSVARIACAISKLIPGASDDLCFVGGLLHDIGKLFTYELDGVKIRMTDEGQLFDHVFMGANFISNYAEDCPGVDVSMPDTYFKISMLTHIILSHHGKLEYGAAVPPLSMEALIVSHADGVDASTQQIIEQSKKLGNAVWTDRIYALSNKPHITTQFMERLFATETNHSGVATPQ